MAILRDGAMMRRWDQWQICIQHAGLAAPLWIQQIVFSDAACVIRMVAATMKMN